MTRKPTPGEIASEQLREGLRWADGLRGTLFDAAHQGDYDTIAYLHGALAGLVRRMQEREQKRQRQAE
ncbi:MAG TPA: hypothetical protein DEU95_06225 [Chloroflexi bacterium]|nr:hypothetical protein [Chloroflexota bacterium]